MQRAKVQKSVWGFGFLGVVDNVGIKTVGDGEWEELEMAVDSGAGETVVAESALGAIEMVESESKKRGVKYEVADGTLIENLGEKRFVGVTEEGLKRGVVAQVCGVNKSLLSVRRVVAERRNSGV